MCAIYRGERWNLSYGIETSYGEAPNGVLTATNLLGVFDDANLPDLDFDYQPYWMMGTTNNRNYYAAYKGRARSVGSISDIMLLDGRPLFLPLANAITHAGGGPYTHTINETTNLSSLRLVTTNVDDGGTTGLVRWFSGGKVNRATYSCQEGDTLKMSLDEVIFKMPYFKDNDSTNISPWYDADTAAQSLTYPTTEPYYFSHGVIKIKLPYLTLTEVTIPSIRNFRLEVNNNLEPKYYISTNDEKVPYQIYEGRREYRLSMTIDLIDNGSFDKNSLFLEVLNQGMSSSLLKGAAIDITFTRGSNDSIQFITPANYTPAAGGDGQGSLIVRAPINIVTEGVISVPMEMICRNLKVVVTDSIAGASYPV